MKGLYLTINRPDKANSLTSELLDQIRSAYEGAIREPDIRYVVLAGNGKHLCAGADLEWMRSSAKLDREGNVKEAERLSAMFQAIADCPLPTIVLAKGRVYGGAVGLIAACDVVISDEGSIFCLSEARLGIIPAVIAPYLLGRISVGRLRELTITSRELNASEAHSLGLSDVVTATLDHALESELTQIKRSGPEAIALMKSLLRSGATADHCKEAIADARSSQQGKAGLDAFFAKSKPEWAR